jgi:LuxR family maltose regulon positive regulatory protein
MPDAVVVGTWLERIAARLDAGAQGPSPLTTAELRILGFLPTHLSFREIADRLYVSANTVKTQAHAVYRKLDAASRSDAVTRATELGLLEL